MIKSDRRTFNRLAACALGSAALAGLSRTAAAATPVRFGYAPGNDSVALFVALEQGYFAKRGIEPKLTLMPSPPVSVSALVSKSIDVVAVGTGSTLQAVDGGMPLVMIAAAQTLPTGTQLVIAATTGSNIKTAQDLVGKRVAVIGFSSILHTMTKRWLEERGVDYDQVNFVETGLAQMPDLMKARQVDAAVIADPVYPKILQDQSGYKIGDVYETAPSGVALSAYTASIDWVDRNRPTVDAARQALAEGAGFANDHPDAVRKAIVKYLKMPEDVVRQIGLPGLGSTMTVEQVQFVYDVMDHQKLFQRKLDLSRLVLG